MSGPSALVHPSGRVEMLAGWGQEKTIPLDVPTYRAQTFYSQHGDWIGRVALGFALLLHLAALLAHRSLPKTWRVRTASVRATPRRPDAVPI